MPRNFFHEMLDAHVAAGSDPTIWWDEDRIPLGSIDKRVTDLLDLRGKKAVVVGGAGLNLGQACVNRLAGLGADVAVVDLDPQVAAQGRMRWNQPPDVVSTVQAAADRWGTTVIGVHGDAMDWDDVRRYMRECHERLGGIDVLVNNAADAVIGDFSQMSKEDVYRTVQGTLVGPMQCTHAALEYMISQGSGRIINVGSGSALAASPGFTVYGTMKAGVNTFTKFLAHEVARHGIQVLGVNAGVMWGPGRQPLPPDSVESLIPRLRTAIQRFALPEEVANMVAFLASDAASCMTGTMVDMTGGRV